MFEHEYRSREQISREGRRALRPDGGRSRTQGRGEARYADSSGAAPCGLSLSKAR